MNKFLILILFIALIYLAYSYRHDIIKGGIFKPDNKIKTEAMYSKSPNDLYKDRYKLYMQSVSYKTLRYLASKAANFNILAKSKRRITGDNRATIKGYTDMLQEAIRATMRYPENCSENNLCINLGLLLNNVSNEYNIPLDVTGIKTFFLATQILLVDMQAFYNENLDDEVQALHTTITNIYKGEENVICIPYYVDTSGKQIYVLDLWQLGFLDEDKTKKTSKEYRDYFSESDTFDMSRFKDPGLFINSNPKLDKNEMYSVGPTEEFIKKFKKVYDDKANEPKS